MPEPSDAMTTDLSQGRPGVTTSQSKTPNTSSSSSSQQPSRAKLRTENRRVTLDTDSVETASDKNTVALIRRVLCPDASVHGSSAPQQPLQELLPPLTSSNDIDLQLYALIAIIIKEFVYSWYAKITPDHIFIDEVLQLIAHCTRALEQRLRQVDVAQLILDEVTGLVEAHINAYRIAARDPGLISVKTSIREIYHSLNPHPGLYPVPDSLTESQCAKQQENENLYRHLLAQGVLAVLLPTEDLENVCLRTMVEDILSDLILGNEVSGKICEGWFIWTAISKIIALVKQRESESMLDVEQKVDGAVEKNRLERFGLLSNDGANNESLKRNQSTISLWAWKILYSIYVAYVTMRFIIGGLLHTAFSNTDASITDMNLADHHTTLKTTNQSTSSRPVLSYRVFDLVAQLVRIPQRMPWLSGSLSLIQSLILTGPGKLGDRGSVLDRYLRSLIGTFVLTPTILPVLLFTIRTTLFPSNARPPPRPNNDISSPSVQQAKQGQAVYSAARTTDSSSSPNAPQDASSTSMPASKPGNVTPSPSEVAAIKRQCAVDILSLVPGSIAQGFFSANTENRASIGADNGITTSTNNDNKSNSQSGKGNDQRISTARNSSSPGDEEKKRDDDHGSNNDNNDNNSSNSKELVEAIEMDLLDPFSDAYCNKHLIYAIIEMVLVKLIPELSEHSVSGLMEERGIVL